MKYDHVDRANSAVRSGVGTLETYEYALKNALDRGALVALSQGFAAPVRPAAAPPDIHSDNAKRYGIMSRRGCGNTTEKDGLDE